MSSVIAAPEAIATAATDLASIGSTLREAHTAAAASTLAVLPAGADEVSANIAHLFSAHALDYQSMAGQAAAFHEQFTKTLSAGAGSYASAEAANAAAFQPENAIAGAVSSALAPAQNPLTSLFNNALVQVQNALDSLLWFIFAPILQPIIDVIAQILAKVIIEIFLAPFGGM
jgi:PE family